MSKTFIKKIECNQSVLITFWEIDRCIMLIHKKAMFLYKIFSLIIYKFNVIINNHMACILYFKE